MNIVQLQYTVLKALEEKLHEESPLNEVTINMEYNHELSMTFPISETKRAKVAISHVDRVYCEECSNEIECPTYNQNKHIKCN